MAGRARQADVVVVGGGPGGSVLAWDLARRGISVLVLERTRFPREKVCGDYVDPRGLQVLRRMGCLGRLEQNAPLPITHSAAFVEWERCYGGPIPFYGVDEALPPHAYVIPRDELDSAMLQTAERAGARVHQETTVTAVRTGSDGVTIEARRSSKSVRYRSRLVVGADGANSIVAASAGVLADDPRHTAVAQRAYAIGVEGELGEVEVFFDEQMFPGYGWMFPIAGGRVNLGVGILSETRRRLDLNVPGLFADFVDRLQSLHPRCVNLELCAPPIGGIVKTYGGAGHNFFEGGLLIGDAGSFVDPMTGEGITPAAESALLAAPVLLAALESGRSDAECLSAYETAFRAYFDPAMTFLDFCAAVMRNRHFARAWLNTLARGCELAQTDQAWARTGGSYFGGLDIRPVGILAQVWIRLVPELLFAWPRSLGGVASRRATTVAELIEWQSAWSRSFVADPLWHARWQMDVQRKSLRLASMNAARDPRAAGIPD